MASTAAKTVFNPYMSGRILAQQQQSSRTAGNRAAVFIGKTFADEAPEVPSKVKKFSMTNTMRSLDQLLKNNVRRLINEEAERQTHFRQLYSTPKPAHF
ncbi:hypothetical protein WR25_16233 [Diploscapter pachys]|uniref:Uncharacterized protein n=1 Tax=Diploscapter pachys TaxID=2018661 RepID=A0A2A2KNL4_9BILA|nr:hypothetical protein WR25_16233 [Diploscapter pachys]